ncbi:MAG: capsid protein [Mesorhizobium sp.]
MNPRADLVYDAGMSVAWFLRNGHVVAVTPSRRTLHAELLRLCARIGYSPPVSR